MLWPEEYEDLREEARGMASTIAELFAGGESGERPTDRDGMVAAMRRSIAPMESFSPDGRDEERGGVPCRVFRPNGEPRGTYVHFHGGAMMIGSPRMNDVQNAELAKRLGVDVVSVDYRLAPEHPFPAGSDDCLAATRAVLDETSGPIVLGGESAGGYFTALTLLRVRDELGAVERVAGVNLVFGVFDLSNTPSQLGSRPSDVRDILTDDGGDFLRECYVPGRSVREVRSADCSPLFADLTGLPPALFTVGTADHLLDDSLFLASRWQVWGNEAELAIYPDCIHGFTAFPLELAKRANERIDSFIDHCFSK
jgi:acetyl esterase/lipase